MGLTLQVLVGGEGGLKGWNKSVSSLCFGLNNDMLLSKLIELHKKGKFYCMCIISQQERQRGRGDRGMDNDSKIVLASQIIR